MFRSKCKQCICIRKQKNNFLCTQKVVKLRLNHWCHMDYFNDVFATFLSLDRGRLCCLSEGQRALGIHQKYLNLCFEDERSFYRFGTTWGWVINNRFVMFGWTIPLIQFNKQICHLPLLHSRKSGQGSVCLWGSDWGRVVFPRGSRYLHSQQTQPRRWWVLGGRVQRRSGRLSRSISGGSMQTGECTNTQEHERAGLYTGHTENDFCIMFTASLCSCWNMFCNSCFLPAGVSVSSGSSSLSTHCVSVL